MDYKLTDLVHIPYWFRERCVYLVAQSCLTLGDRVDYSLLDSSVHGDSPGKNTGVGCHALLQGIFPTQGSNPGLLTVGSFFRLIHQGRSRERRHCPFSLGASHIFQAGRSMEEASFSALGHLLGVEVGPQCKELSVAFMVWA